MWRCRPPHHRRSGRRVDPRQKTSEPSLRLTVDSIAKAAARPDVCAVAVRSAVRWGSFPNLPARLEAEGYDLTEHDGGPKALYVKTPCERP